MAQSSVQDLRQMVFDMDSEAKTGIDKRSSQEQDFKKLGFQVLLSICINLVFCFLILFYNAEALCVPYELQSGPDLFPGRMT